MFKALPISLSVPVIYYAEIVELSLIKQLVAFVFGRLLIDNGIWLLP
jgi:hypothetical protein